MKKKSKKAGSRFLTPVKIIVIFSAITLLLTVAIILLARPSKEALIKEGQIQIKRGSRVVTVNENGLVEYKSEKGIYYEAWDSGRTSAFFELMRAKALTYLNNPTGPIEGGYEVTLYVGGEIVTIYIAGDDEELEEVFGGFSGGTGGGSGDLGEYFDDTGSSGGGGATNPTPTGVGVASLTPTPTGAGGGSGSGGGAVQLPPDCDLYGTEVTKRTVISNAICDFEEK